MPLVFRLHPRATRAVERAVTHRPTTVTGLVARIDEQGTVVIDLPDDQRGSELVRRIEAAKPRDDREAGDDRQGLSMGVRL